MGTVRCSTSVPALFSPSSRDYLPPSYLFPFACFSHLPPPPSLHHRRHHHYLPPPLIDTPSSFPFSPFSPKCSVAGPISRSLRSLTPSFSTYALSRRFSSALTLLSISVVLCWLSLRHHAFFVPHLLHALLASSFGIRQSGDYRLFQVEQKNHNTVWKTVQEVRSPLSPSPPSPRHLRSALLSTTLPTYFVFVK